MRLIIGMTGATGAIWGVRLPQERGRGTRTDQFGLDGTDAVRRQGPGTARGGHRHTLPARTPASPDAGGPAWGHYGTGETRRDEARGMTRGSYGGFVPGAATAPPALGLLSRVVDEGPRGRRRVWDRPVGASRGRAGNHVHGCSGTATAGVSSAGEPCHSLPKARRRLDAGCGRRRSGPSHEGVRRPAVRAG